MKKIKHLHLLPIILISIVAFKIISQDNFITDVLEKTISLSVPFLWAIAIAYLLFPLMKIMETKLKFKRCLSLSISYLLVFLILFALIVGIIPSVTSSFTDMISEAPSYVEKLNNWYEEKLEEFESLQRASEVYDIDIKKITSKKIENIIKTISDNVQDYFIKIGKTAFNITAGFLKFIIGLAMSIFILMDIEKFMIAFRKFGNTFLGEKNSDNLAYVFHEIDDIFGRYLVGKAIDSLIIGILCFIGLSVLNIKFTLLFSVIVGVTNMIPYFGPIIGAIPAVFITIFVNPVQAIWVAIFILILQQLDGNVIGPLIIGDSIGASPFWIIISVFIGGHLFGFWGMLLGVPTIAVIRRLVLNKQDELILKRNKVEIKNCNEQ